MPEFGVLEVEAANKKIRELFIARITEAKGIGRVRNMIADVVMPTPAAVLEAAKLLADGTSGQRGGRGEARHSASFSWSTWWRHHRSILGGKGAPDERERALHRTAGAVCQAHGGGRLGSVPEPETPSRPPPNWREVPDGFEEAVAAMCRENSVPRGEQQTLCHLLLSKVAVRSAVNRHAGSLRTVMTPNGEVTLQRGKDLTQLGWVVGAGGPRLVLGRSREVLDGALFEKATSPAAQTKSPGDAPGQPLRALRLGLLAQSEPARRSG